MLSNYFQMNKPSDRCPFITLPLLSRKVTGKQSHRSGMSFDGPQFPPPILFLSKVVKDEPESVKWIRIEACFANDSILPGIDDAEFDPEGDIRLIEEMLNNDMYSPLPLKDLKCEELKSDLPFETMCDASDYAVGAVLGQHVNRDCSNGFFSSKYLMSLYVIKKEQENLAGPTTYLELEYALKVDPEKKEITETFPLETLRMVTFRGDSNTPWFADIANYLAGNFIVKGMLSQQKKNSLRMLSIIFRRPLPVWICGDLK
ncbi:hypothetical protein Tco_0364166 [Tanacetum coccineum]